MRRKPTTKSRFVAYSGAACIFGMYYIYGWGNTNIPSYIPPSLGAAAIAMLFLAKSIREQEGAELIIPDEFRVQVAKLANIEVMAALMSGLSSIAALTLVQLGRSRSEERVAFCVSMAIFAVTMLVGLITNKKYHQMMRQSGRE